MGKIPCREKHEHGSPRQEPPFIIFWALGNESGNGLNFEAASKAIRDYDNSRILHYCEFPNGHKAVDVDSAMYPPVSSVVNWGKEQTARPFFVCEFAHSMGNALGNFQEYMDAFNGSTRMVGGCIWDFVDQSLHAVRGKDGIYHPAPFKSETLAYGGMYGDHPNQGNFCDNGIILGSRSMTAKSREVKKVYQYIDFSYKNGEITVTNQYYHKPIEGFALYVIVPLHDGSFNTARYNIPTLQPGGQASFKPSFIMDRDKSNLPFIAVADALCPLKDEQTRLSGPQIIGLINQSEAYQYFPGTIKTAKAATATTSLGSLNAARTGNSVSVNGTNFNMKFENGMLSAYTYDGKELISPQFPVQFQIYRAPIDNDSWITGKWNGALKIGKIKETCLKTTVNKPGGNIVQIISDMKTEGSPLKYAYRIVWSIAGNGVIDVAAQFYPNTVGEEIPRLGFTFGTSANHNQVSYLGRGPWANYRDRKTSTWRDVFTTTVDEMFFPYSRPQEMGNRTEVEWLRLYGGGPADKPSLVIGASSPLHPFEASASYYTARELNAARSLDCLPAKNKVIINIDACQMGLGGASCGPRPMPQYQALSQPAALGFIIAPGLAHMEAARSVLNPAHTPVIDRDKEGNVHLISSTPGIAYCYSVNDGEKKPYTKPFPLPEGKIKAWVSGDEKGLFAQIAPAAERQFDKMSLKADWKVLSASSEEPGTGLSQFAIDGDPDTHWHTSYTNGMPHYPHSLAIDMGANTKFSGFNYVPKMSDHRGLIQKYVFYISGD